MKLITFLFLLFPGISRSLEFNITRLAADYFSFKDVRYICYFSCENQYGMLFKYLLHIHSEPVSSFSKILLFIVHYRRYIFLYNVCRKQLCGLPDGKQLPQLKDTCNFREPAYVFPTFYLLTQSICYVTLLFDNKHEIRFK